MSGGSLDKATFPKRPLLSINAAAVLLAISFSYLFAIALAAFCAVGPFLLLGVALRTHGVWIVQALLLLIAGLVTARVILSSLIPRSNRVETLKSGLDLERHPRLRGLIEEITKPLGERLPDEVHLTAVPGAGVTQVGGFLGFGSRRVMFLGLPTLAVMSVAELRAILAHECAHFYAGDTLLGASIYSARAAMTRMMKTLESGPALHQALQRFLSVELLSSLISSFVKWYWKLFLLVTQYVARQQEYRSDELAAYIAGARNLISALEKIHRAHIINQQYWVNMVSPAVNRGVLPHLAEGFQIFLSSPGNVKLTEVVYGKLLQLSKVDPYSTHPPLKLRLDRLEKLCAEPAASEDVGAICFLNDLEACERKLITAMAPKFSADAAKWASWEEIGRIVYFPMWRLTVKQNEQSLSNYTFGFLPELIADPSTVASRMRDQPGTLPTRTHRNDNARQLLLTALSVRLIEKGWQLQFVPGTVNLINGDQKIVPGDLVHLFQTGQIDSAWWLRFCEGSSLVNEPFAIVESK